MLSPHNENCFIEVDAPNANIYEINGTIIIMTKKKALNGFLYCRNNAKGKKVKIVY